EVHQRVIAGAASQQVRSGLAEQPVITVAAIQRIVAATAFDCVVPAEPVDKVVAFRADERVVAGGATDGVRAASTGDHDIGRRERGRALQGGDELPSAAKTELSNVSLSVPETKSLTTSALAVPGAVANRNVSWPVPPMSVSLPPIPESVSLPSRPSSVSAAPLPFIESLNWAPITRSTLVTLALPKPAEPPP